MLEAINNSSSHRHRRRGRSGGEQGARAPTPSEKIQKNFSGKYHVEFGNIVKFRGQI